MRKYFLALILLSASACGKKDSASAVAPLCTPSPLNGLNAFRVGWKATKNAGVGVLGSIGGRGSVDTSGGGLQGALVEIDFNAQTINSGIALRDERIINIFLQADTFSHVTFRGTITSPRNDLPATNDDHIKVSLQGVVTVVGQPLSVTLPAEVVRVGNSIYLMQPSEGAVPFRLLETDVLRTNAENLIRTAGVKAMGENIEVWGSVPLIETCGQ